LRLREELGMATLIATHDLGAAWQIADRTAVLHGGRIAEDGPTETVLTRPAHGQTRALLAAHRQAAPARG
jgi:ABC-type glutathione transport system ATPase component